MVEASSTNNSLLLMRRFDTHKDSIAAMIGLAAI
jgi:hypothetical protein